MHKLLCAAVVLFGVTGCDRSKDSPQPATEATNTPLAIGQPAPDFEGVTQSGERFKLSAHKGTAVIVYFYPKDETPGCTAEAQAFRDDFAKLQAQGATVVGISADSPESHKAFADNHQLPFTLVSDPKGEIAAKYDVPFTLVTQRQTFVVGKDGLLKQIYRKVNVSGHSTEILRALESS